MLKSKNLVSSLLKNSKFSFHETFFSKDLKTYKKAVPTPIEFKNTDFKFGEAISDHMGEILYNQEDGWAAPQIRPLFYLNLHPFNSSLHYAFSCFEGMKAYRDENDNIYLFRPMENMHRFLKSC